MALTLYSSGDLVVQRHSFSKAARVINSHQGQCQIMREGATVTLPESDLLLISVRNIPNLRLIGQKIAAAATSAPDASGLDHSIMSYLGAGSVVSRAFADYILKISPDILVTCLTALHQTRADIPHAIDQVLGLNFSLISGEGCSPAQTI